MTRTCRSTSSPPPNTQILMITLLQRVLPPRAASFSPRTAGTPSTSATPSDRSRAYSRKSPPTKLIPNHYILQTAMGRVYRETTTSRGRATQLRVRCNGFNGMGQEAGNSCSKCTAKITTLRNHAPSRGRQMHTLRSRCTGISRSGTIYMRRNRKT